LFASALVSVDDAAEPQRLRLVFDDGPGVLESASDLVAREGECCSFFTFGIGRAGGRVVLDVSVGSGYADVLSGLERQARAVLAQRSLSAQRLGFTLNEVAELLDAGRHRHGAEATVSSHARVKLADVEAKIADLRLIRDTLLRTIETGCHDPMQCAASPYCPLPFERPAVTTGAPIGSHAG
jgi:hypothetical protein